MPDKSQLKAYGAIAILVVLIAAIGYLAWRVSDLQAANDQAPKIVKIEDTEKADKLQEELHLSQKAAQQLADRISAIHAGSQAPSVTYYTTAPTVEAAATKTADAIQQGDKALPAEALAKTDRTVVTANDEKQKVDVYKINLRNNHKIKAGVMVTSGRAYPGVGYQAGRWEGMAYMNMGGKNIVAGTVTYTVKEW